jgi:hypothetical protein
MLATAADALRGACEFSSRPLTVSLHTRNRRFTGRADSPSRNVRRPILVLTLASLALAAVSPAQPATFPATRVAGSEWLELADGRGFASFGQRGAAVGKVRRGRVRVANLADTGAPKGWVRGCESKSGQLSGRIYCSGTRLRFYIHEGRWRIRTKGRGIDVSAVIRGSVGLDGAACTRCTFKIGDRPRRRWPATLRFFAVGS